MTAHTIARAPQATCDSADYNRTFYGILNGQGKFWTPLAFADEGAAREWLETFVAKDRKRFGDMLITHKVVPVRVQLSALLEDGPPPEGARGVGES